MAESIKTTVGVLQNAQITLKNAKLGLNDFLKGGERELAGLTALVTSGRAVTFVLQNLKHLEPNFESWYESYQKEMANDSLLKFFKELRNEIEKEGEHSLDGCGIHVHSLETSKYPPPPNASEFFVGDEKGGMGWIVQNEDGSKSKIYLVPSADVATFHKYFSSSHPKFPTQHLGRQLSDTSAESLCKLYIEYLDALVQKAKQKFGRS